MDNGYSPEQSFAITWHIIQLVDRTPTTTGIQGVDPCLSSPVDSVSIDSNIAIVTTGVHNGTDLISREVERTESESGSPYEKYTLSLTQSTAKPPKDAMMAIVHNS